MLKQTLKLRSTLALILGLSLLSLGSLAQADDHHGDYRGDHHGNRYHYRHGHWYNYSEVIVPNIVVGEEVEALPPQYTTVVVGNTPYYYDNARYYNRSPDGAYIVVAPPARSPSFNVRVQL